MYYACRYIIVTACSAAQKFMSQFLAMEEFNLFIESSDRQRKVQFGAAAFRIKILFAVKSVCTWCRIISLCWKSHDVHGIIHRPQHKSLSHIA